MQFMTPAWFDDSTFFRVEAFEQYEGVCVYECHLSSDEKSLGFPNGYVANYITFDSKAIVYIVKGDISIETSGAHNHMKSGQAAVFEKDESIHLNGSGSMFIVTEKKFDFNGLIG